MTQPWILGLTGGIGLVDADHAARWVVEPGRPALAKIVERFGDGILLPDGQLDRAALRERIFQAPEERRWLEQLLHPLIGAEIVQYLARAESPYAILVSPLLVESGQRQMTHRVLVVDTPEHLQLQRTMLRDKVSEEQVRSIPQARRDERLKHADDVLVNDGDLSHLQREVERLHAFYLTLRGGRA